MGGSVPGLGLNSSLPLYSCVAFRSSFFPVSPSFLICWLGATAAAPVLGVCSVHLSCPWVTMVYYLHPSLVALKWIFLSDLPDRQCTDLTESLCPPHFGKCPGSGQCLGTGRGFREPPAPAEVED